MQRMPGYDGEMRGFWDFWVQYNWIKAVIFVLLAVLGAIFMCVASKGLSTREGVEAAMQADREESERMAVEHIRETQGDEAADAALKAIEASSP
ncbi:MAG: hypothetical protein GF320_15085 [Armatimonadia bacterium]|nr:hypothetical protein [Armatimonadia bacterium]